MNTKLTMGGLPSMMVSMNSLFVNPQSTIHIPLYNQIHNNNHEPRFSSRKILKQMQSTPTTHIHIPQSLAEKASGEGRDHI